MRKRLMWLLASIIVPTIMLFSGITALSEATEDTTWIPSNGPSFNKGYILDIAVNPVTPGNTYAIVGTPASINSEVSNPILFKSVDSGSSWSAILEGEGWQYPNTVSASGSLIVVGSIGCAGGFCIQRSTNAGLDWAPVFTFPSAATWGGIEDIKINHISTTHILAVGVEGRMDGPPPPRPHGTIYRSTDNGETFSTTLFIDDVSSLYSLAWNTFTPTLALAGGYVSTGSSDVDGTIYRTDDGGYSWTAVFTPTDKVTSVLFDEQSGGNAYAATTENDLYRSNDKGVSWTKIATGTAGTKLDQQSSWLHTASGEDILISVDDGFQWETMGSASNSGNISTLESDSSQLYIGSSYGGIFTSTNHGATMNPANVGIQVTATVSAITFDPNDSQNIISHDGISAFTTTNGGSTWNLLTSTPARWKMTLRDFAIDPSDPDVILLTGEDPCDKASIFHSSDAGISWTPVYTPTCAEGYSSSDWSTIIHHPISPSIVYAAGKLNFTDQSISPQATILQSTNGGLDWTIHYTTEESFNFHTIVFNPLTSTIMYAGGGLQSGGAPTQTAVFRSTNSGQEWQKVLTHNIPEGPPDTFSAIASDGQNVYVTAAGSLWPTYSGTLYHSSAAGAVETWQEVYTNTGKYLLADSSLPDTLYSARDGWAGMSSDGGETWISLTENIPPLIFDFNINSRKLYIASVGVWTYNLSNLEIIYLPMVIGSQ